MSDHMTAEQLRAEFQKWAVVGLSGLQASWRENPAGAAMPEYFLRRSDDEARTYHYDVVETAYLAWCAVRLSGVAAVQWYDGETAPKDGSPFISVTNFGDFEIGRWETIEQDRYEDAGNGLYRKVESVLGFWNCNTPKLWTRLPALPLLQLSIDRDGTTVPALDSSALASPEPPHG